MKFNPVAILTLVAITVYIVNNQDKLKDEEFLIKTYDYFIVEVIVVVLGINIIQLDNDTLEVALLAAGLAYSISTELREEEKLEEEQKEN